jgi:hypothetical protein
MSVRQFAAGKSRFTQLRVVAILCKDRGPAKASRFRRTTFARGKGFGAFRPASCGVICDPHPDTAHRQATCRPAPCWPCSGYATTRKGGQGANVLKGRGVLRCQMIRTATRITLKV